MAIDSAEWEAQQRIVAAHKAGEQALDLSFLRLTTLPERLGNLTQLTQLHLSSNRLTTLPESLGNLSQLTQLHLNGNCLSTLPEWLGDLTQLTQLHLNDNCLNALPASLVSLTQLQQLYLHNNQELGIPLEILGPALIPVLLRQETPANPADILHYYFRSREEPPRRLNEAKILLVGQGGVGKTCLVERLVNNTFDPNEAKTEGINIVQWTVPGAPQSNGDMEPIRLNIWDFGGQEIMHATHQFFLTQRSLYLVVLDARKGENESNMNYWLKIIQSYGGESPVLIVTNKHEPPNYLDLNERRLMLDYAPNLQGFFKVSCRDGTGLEALRIAIEAQIHALPHVSDEVPARYFRVKDELETRARRNDFIDMESYRTLCQDHNVTAKQDQDLLLRFLHDLGNVLNFDDPAAPYELRDTNILNPEWVTGGVYKILNNNGLLQAGGRLELEQLGTILDDHRRYPPERQRFIIEMMRKFELCFDFPDSQPLRLLIPELLPKNEPDLNWATAEALNFEYHYSVLPGGIIPRFIVKMHHNLTAMPTYWRSGMVLQIEGNRAFVRGDTQAGRVYISILGPGPGRRRALSVIRDAFKAIHATIPKLDVQERVPLPRQPTVTVDYPHLLKLEALGETRFIPEGLEEPVDVRQLLDVIEPASLRQERQEREQAFSGTPGLASRRVPPLVMQETTISAGAEASAGGLVAIRARLDQKAKRQVKLCWLLATIAIFTCAGVLIRVLGWDVLS